MFSYKTKTYVCFNMTNTLSYTYECPLRGSRNKSGWDLSYSWYMQIKLEEARDVAQWNPLVVSIEPEYKLEEARDVAQWTPLVVSIEPEYKFYISNRTMN